ncbi:Uncharacterised protein [Raoultella ornithinolytica]|nr:Uncharacterised protein [Raoultella ornithinolytica]
MCGRIAVLMQGVDGPGDNITPVDDERAKRTPAVFNIGCGEGDGVLKITIVN